ncbi:MAG: hypothetical protein JSV94_06280 [Methanobacteriota archaeon]|nr:MAG: hypothetical protein JSV94_06280 [Euryarchaeota archaeon]
MERLSWYILRRLLVLAIGVLVILTVEFCLFRVLPDDPMRLALPDAGPYDPSVASDWYVDWREHAIDMFEQPVYMEYFEFIGDMLTGDFGSSLTYQSDVSDHIYSAMWRTLILFGSSLLLCLILAPLVGGALSRVRSYYRRQSLSFLALALFSVPVLAWQWFMLRYLSLEWRLLPYGGIAPYGSSGIHLEYVIMPLASIVLASLGAFILCAKDGQTRASAAVFPNRSTLVDGVFAALPNIQFMIAASMIFVVSAEWFFHFWGLGWYFIESLYQMDYFPLQASFFLLAIMVFMVNFAMETIVTLIRPGRKLDLCLREDEDRYSAASETSVRVGQLSFSFSRIVGALIRVARDYLRSPVGMVSLAVFIGMIVLAITGPWFSSDEIDPIGIRPWQSSTYLFLDGATALVAISILAGLFALLAGITLGIVAGYSRPYADGIVLAIMQGLIAIPFIGLFVLLRMARWNPFDVGYLNAALACSIPIMALVTILSFHGFVSSRNRVAAATEGASKGVRLIHSGPAVASWALSGLKYGLPLTIVAVFVCDFIRLTHFSSWGAAFYQAVIVYPFASIGWDYILLPLIGSALLIGSIFLILDTIERIIRARLSGLI